MANIKIIKEVTNEEAGGWKLYFQWCEYIYDDGSENQFGYRFIWKRPDGSLQAARGQARIPSLKDMNDLIERATYAGWLGTIERATKTEE